MRFFLALAMLLLLADTATAQQRPMTFEDVMQFKAIRDHSISADGQWLVFTATPDRGDAEVVVRHTQNDTRYTVPLGNDPVISKDGKWVAMTIDPSLEVKETEDDVPNAGMALLNTATGDVEMLENIASFAFSANGEWLAIHHEEEEDDEEDGEEAEEDGRLDGSAAASRLSDDEAGTNLELRKLGSDMVIMIEAAMDFAFDEAGTHIAYSVLDEDNEDNRNGLYVRGLASDSEMLLDDRENGHYTAMSWSEHDNTLAFVASTKEEDEAGPGALHQWSVSPVKRLTSGVPH